MRDEIGGDLQVYADLYPYSVSVLAYYIDPFLCNIPYLPMLPWCLYKQ